MMRSLWTAASGMITQQTNVDVISNNLANINTTGYKKETVEFKTLLYQTLQEQSYDNNGTLSLPEYRLALSKGIQRLPPIIHRVH